MPHICIVYMLYAIYAIIPNPQRINLNLDENALIHHSEKISVHTPVFDGARKWVCLKMGVYSHEMLKQPPLMGLWRYDGDTIGI